MSFNCINFAPVDFETGERYLVSPTSGRLLVVPEEYWERADWKARFLKNEGVITVENYSSWSNLKDLRATTDAVEISIPFHFYVAYRLAQLAAKFIPLRSYINFIDRLPVKNERLSINVLKTLLNRISGYKQASCLVRSLTQAFLLKINGYPLDIHIGVWLPTTRMHAWVCVESENQMLLVDDTVDKISHYQPAVIFSIT